MTQSLDGLNVLLVEDDFLIQMDVQTLLEDAGATVVTACTVKEGIEALKERYHAAILDIRLPDGEVRPVAEVLAEMSTPIIFHSGNVDNTVWIHGFPNAVTLSKPVAQSLLVDTVKRQAGASA